VERPYQTEMIDRVVAAFASGTRAVCLQVGTGGGKTFLASRLLARAVAKGYRAVFIAGLDTLIEDTHERLSCAGIHAGFVQAGRPVDPSAPVQVCSTMTLHARGEAPPADLLIWDECQRTMAATCREVLGRYPSAAVLGLTAFPQRGDGRPLGDVFDVLICGPSNRELVAGGYLVPCEVVAPDLPPGKALAMDPSDALVTYGELPAIVFAANLAHAKRIVDSCRERGMTADLFVGETSRAARQRARAQLRDGSLQVLVSVQAIVEGFDAPEIRTIVLARAFGVCGSYLQAIGRGLRPSPGKTKCTVIDLRAAYLQHGLPDETRELSLKGTAQKRVEGIVALAKCKSCLAIFRPQVACPRCGQVAASAPRIPVTLTRAEKLHVVSQLPQHVRDARYLAQLLWVAQRRVGLHGIGAETWARRAFARRFSRDPQLREAS
jgi:DNA repair protein RadD